MKNRFLTILVCIFAFSTANAVEIVRYVAEGGTGDGLSKESPTGNLKAVLEMSYKVDKVTIYAEPGYFSVPLVENPDGRPTYKNVYLYGGGESEIADVKDKTVIEGDLAIKNGIVCNIEFVGADYKDKFGHRMVGSLRTSGCNVYFSLASILEFEAVPSYHNQIYGFKGKSLYVKRDEYSIY